MSLNPFDFPLYHKVHNCEIRESVLRTEIREKSKFRRRKIKKKFEKGRENRRKKIHYGKKLEIDQKDVIVARVFLCVGRLRTSQKRCNTSLIGQLKQI
jgi:hypothetical protein